MKTTPVMTLSAAITLRCCLFGGGSAHGQCEVWQALPVGGVLGPSNPAVYSIATYNGDLIVGGEFTQAGVTSVTNIARLSGSNWFFLSSGLSGGSSPKVYALTVYNGDLIAGGDFTTSGGIPVNRIARWNGTFWQPLGNGMDLPVRALTVFGGKLIAGGDFNTAGGQGASKIAQWDGSTWQTMGGFNGPVTCFTVFNNELIAGGVFTTPAARIARWSGSTWLSLPAGGFNNTVNALAVYNSELFAGGQFTMVDGLPQGTYIARLTAASGWDPPIGGGGTNGPVYSLGVYNGKLIVGGAFSFAGVQSIGYGIANWNATTGWAHVGGGVSSNGDVLVLSSNNGDMIAGGKFVSAGGVSAFRVARYLGHKWLNASSGFFQNPASWSIGSAPSPTCSVVFGVTPSTTPYTVTFSSNVGNSACSVTNHNPTFDLAGFVYSPNQLTVGDTQTASLAITNGTLNTAATSIGSFGTLTVNGATMTTPTLSIAASGTLSVISGGSLTISAPTTIVPLATLTGDGTIFGTLINNGTVRPGNSTTLGQLSLVGGYTQTSTGVLNILIGPASHGRLVASGNVAISGTLKVQLTGGADPQAGQQFPFLSSGAAINGSFGTVLLPFIGADQVLSIQNTAAAQGPPGRPSDGRGDGGGSSGGGGGGIVITVSTPNGSPELGSPQTFTLPGEPTGISSVSIDTQTAATDLALSVKAPLPTDTGNALVLINNGSGTAFTPVVVPVGREPSGIVATNLSGTESDDLAVSNRGDDNVTILFHQGSGAFINVNVNVGNSPSAIAAGNFRGAGLNDLVVTNQDSDSITVLRNNGNLTFTALPSVAVGGQPSDVASAMLTGASLPDLVVANSASDTITVLSTTANAVYFPVIVIPVGVQPIHVRPADVDNDRDLDVLVVNQGSHSISVVQNSSSGGSAQFSEIGQLPVNGDPQSLTSWDMDDDGDVDAVVVVNDDQLGQVIRILRNDSSPGQIAFTLFDPLGQGEEPRLVSNADVTGDANDDLVAVNVTTTNLAGGASSSLAIRPNIVGPPRIPGDINHSGHVDIDDLVLVITSWGACPNPCVPYCPADVTHNCLVDIDDLVMVIVNWG